MHSWRRVIIFCFRSCNTVTDPLCWWAAPRDFYFLQNHLENWLIRCCKKTNPKTLKTATLDNNINSTFFFTYNYFPPSIIHLTDTCQTRHVWFCKCLLFFFIQIFSHSNSMHSILLASRQKFMNQKLEKERQLDRVARSEAEKLNFPHSWATHTYTLNTHSVLSHFSPSV